MDEFMNTVKIGSVKTCST